MKIVAEESVKKMPQVVIDSRLNELDNIVLFPDKVEQAKKIIEKIGFPKQSTISKSKNDSLTC